jgi:Fur family transcriptional regulator, ferric uptake regulator
MNAQVYQRKLKEHGLKNTRQRRLVLEAMDRIGKPTSPYDIREHIVTTGGSVNVVTVYRIIENFEGIGIAHRHPCDGHYALCSMPQESGHHGFLHCVSCGRTQEFSDEGVCRLTQRIARHSNFRVASHVNEIIGTCASCLA